MNDIIEKEIALRELSNKDLKNIGKAIREDLALRGMTSKELAEEVGVTEATISRLLHGLHRPSDGLLIKIGKVLKDTPIPPEKAELPKF